MARRIGLTVAGGDIVALSVGRKQLPVPHFILGVHYKINVFAICHKLRQNLHSHDCSLSPSRLRLGIGPLDARLSVITLKTPSQGIPERFEGH